MKTIELTKAKVAIVDDEDYEMLVNSGYRWELHSSGNGYFHAAAYNYKGGKTTVTLMHRIILGVTDKRIEVDHINGNPLDNRRCNIRIATRSQNAKNRKRSSHSGCEYKGVALDKKKLTPTWRARITVNGERISIGSFKNIEDAARAYDEAAKMYFGEFARLNFA